MLEREFFLDVEICCGRIHHQVEILCINQMLFSFLAHKPSLLRWCYFSFCYLKYLLVQVRAACGTENLRQPQPFCIR